MLVYGHELILEIVRIGFDERFLPIQKKKRPIILTRARNTKLPNTYRVSFYDRGPRSIPALVHDYELLFIADHTFTIIVIGWECISTASVID